MEKKEGTKIRIFILQDKASINIVGPNRKRIIAKKGDIKKTESDKMAAFYLKHWFIEIKSEGPEDSDIDKEGEEE